MDALKKTSEINNTLKAMLLGLYCPICGRRIVEDNTWTWSHLPYINITGDFIEAGYICPKRPDNPVIVLRVGSGSTQVYK